MSLGPGPTADTALPVCGHPRVTLSVLTVYHMRYVVIVYMISHRTLHSVRPQGIEPCLRPYKRRVLTSERQALGGG